MKIKMTECGLSNSSSSAASTACTNETEECEFDSNTTTDSYTTTTIAAPTVSLLNRLKCAERSSLARKRKVKTNPPPVGAKKGQRHTPLSYTYTPKSVTPAQRVKDFSDESLTVSGGRLFCNACREEVCMKSQVIRMHIKSKKHASGKDGLKKRKVQDMDIAEAFKAYNSTEHVVGETLSSECQVQLKVVKAFLRAAVPLSKVDYFRELLEDNGPRLAGRRSLSDLVPFVRDQEEKRILKEIEGKKGCVIFDGTTRMGETMAIIVRFMSDDWEIQQRRFGDTAATYTCSASS